MRKNLRSRPPGYYLGLYLSLRVLPECRARVDFDAQAIARLAERYRRVEAATGVPWPLVGALHTRESARSFAGNLFNGEPLNQVTTLHPRGLGPWSTWEESAVAALTHPQHTPARPARFNVETIGDFAERYNGPGYLKKLASPYVFAGSNHGMGVGKYRENEKGSWYDPKAVDKQSGVLTMLWAGEQLELWRVLR